MRDKPGNRPCSFRGKSQEQVPRLIASKNTAYISSECVALCNETIAKEEAKG